MLYAQEKKVDKDAMPYKFKMIVLTNLGSTSVTLFYAPNVANLVFWKTVPTIAL